MVRFSVGERAWIANFVRGSCSYDGVVSHPDSRHTIVVAGGDGFMVNPAERRITHCFGGDIERAVQVPELELVLIGNGLWFEALGRGGLRWKSARISWDEMRNVEVDGATVRGEAWAPEGYAGQGIWSPFLLDAETGRFTGGSYHGPQPSRTAVS